MSPPPQKKAGTSPNPLGKTCSQKNFTKGLRKARMNNTVFLVFQAGPDDIRNFDTAFTEETVPYSVCVSSDYSIVNASVLEADDAFVGFSYAPPSEDLFL